jgi:hypothetical protein
MKFVVVGRHVSNCGVTMSGVVAGKSHRDQFDVTVTRARRRSTTSCRACGTLRAHRKRRGLLEAARDAIRWSPASVVHRQQREGTQHFGAVSSAQQGAIAVEEKFLADVVAAVTNQ